MKILLTGANGQLGRELVRNKPRNINLIKLFRKDLDLSDPEACFKIIIDENPDWVINAAAYTNVEKAEIEKDLALKVNAYAPEAFAKALNITGGKLLQISTDYLFDGSQKEPYKTNQMPNPINHYGISKSQGEKKIQNIFKNKKQGLILRTSRVIGPEGKNFLLTILNLYKEKKEIKVVKDEYSCSSNTLDLSKVCWEIIEKSRNRSHNIPSILHWRDLGVASWYDIAKTIGDVALDLEIISNPAKVFPVNSSQYPTKAKRPKYSILDCSLTEEVIDFTPRHWKDSISNILSQILKNN